MKKFELSVVFFLAFVVLTAQIPAGLSYQTVVRNNAGEIIGNKTVKFKFSIIRGTESLTPVYIETQSVTTNNFGFANVIIGKGTPVQSVFSSIEWDQASHLLRVELDASGGSDFVLLGTVELMSVPYAFHAQTVDYDLVNDADADSANEIQELSLDGNVFSLSRDEGSVELPSSGTGPFVSGNGITRNTVLTDDPTQSLDVNGNARFRAIASDAYYEVLNRISDGTLTTATSDERLKENINSLQSSLDKIMQLRGVSFTWKSNPEYGTRIGFIAQEFEKVIPELVYTNEVDGYKGINYAETIAVIVEAVKEQQKIIEYLKAENEKLQAENEVNSKDLRKIREEVQKLNARLVKVESVLGKSQSSQVVGGQMIARWNLQEMWRGYIPYDFVFNASDQTLISWSENTKVFNQKQEQLQVVADELNKADLANTTSGSGGAASSFENDQSLMNYFKGIYYSFSAVGGGQTGGTERQISLCSDGRYYFSSESGYSGAGWGTAAQGGGGGNWRITGTKTSGTIIMTDASSKSTIYKYEVCGDGCIYLGNTKFAYAGNPEYR